MLYYLGKGTEFEKEKCKEYKTSRGALEAAKKDEAFVVWDETGKVVDPLIDNAPDGVPQTNPDSAAGETGGNAGVPQTNPDSAAGETGGNAGVPQTNPDSAAGETGDNAGGDKNGEGQTNTPPASNEDENEANTQSQNTGNDTIIPQGTMIVTVICDGTLNLRRNPNWGNESVCGRASRGQSYYVKEIRTVDGKKMVRTIDDLYLSGESEHVQFEQL